MSASLLDGVIAVWPTLTRAQRMALVHRVVFAPLAPPERDWRTVDVTVLVPLIIGSSSRRKE